MILASREVLKGRLQLKTKLKQTSNLFTTTLVLTAVLCFPSLAESTNSPDGPSKLASPEAPAHNSRNAPVVSTSGTDTSTGTSTSTSTSTSAGTSAGTGTGTGTSAGTGTSSLVHHVTSASVDNKTQDVAAAKKVDKPKADLPNFHEVHPYLFRGGEPTEAGLKKLKEMGVATIIDLRAPTEMHIDEPAAAKKLGFHYINLVMDSHAPTDKQVETVLTEIERAKNESEKGVKDKSIFVHCAHGSDRTGCMIGIWRVTQEGWDYPTTYKEMRQYYFTPKFTRLSGAVEEYANKTAKH